MDTITSALEQIGAAPPIVAQWLRIPDSYDVRRIRL
jgi:hypothetical protein